MRKLIYSMMVSLDGFIQRPNHDIDWIIIDEELHQFINDQQAEVDTFLYGRGMYEIMSAYWPTADSDPSIPGYMLEFANIWKNMQKIVFSNTLEKVEWNSRLVKGNIVEEVKKLIAQPGKALSLGGANLAATFIKQNMVDEYQLFVQPTALGIGTPFFPVLDNIISMKLIETHRFACGVVLLRYQKGNPIKN